MDEVSKEEHLYQRRKNVVSRQIGNEGLAIVAETGDIVGLNETGGFILSQLESPTSAQALASKISEHFSVENCSDDIQIFLTELLDKNLIDVVHANDAR